MEGEVGTDSMRRAAAILLIILGGAALCWLGGGTDATAANEAMEKTIAAARKQAAEKDPRLANARRFEDGGWIYVHLEGDPATVGF